MSVDACFTLPDDAGWSAYFPTVDVNGQAIGISESAPLELRLKKSENTMQVISFDQTGLSQVRTEPANPEDKGQRCDRFIFIVAPEVKGPFTVTFGSIVALPREGQACSAANVEKFQKALDKRNTHVIVGCESSDNPSSGGMEGLVIKEKPQTMSEEEALSLLSNPAITTDAYGISGPWVFEWDPAR